MMGNEKRNKPLSNKFSRKYLLPFLKITERPHMYHCDHHISWSPFYATNFLSCTRIVCHCSLYFSCGSGQICNQLIITNVIK